MNRIALASTAGLALAALTALTGCSSFATPAAARPPATVTVTAGLASTPWPGRPTGPASTPWPGRRAGQAKAAATARATAGTTATDPSATPGPAATSATPAPSSPASSAPASPGSSAPAGPGAGAVPALGQPAGVFAHGAGFGLVRPARIFNGGDPTGLVTGITWGSWGGASATGTGTSEYEAPGQSVAAGREEPAKVVAFDLGTCDGKLMYQAVEWYFPQHGQSFRPGQYENVCAGRYVPSP